MPITKLNLSRFDFVSIRLAVLCAQTENLTTAARACHLVLPAASRRIRELELAIGQRVRRRTKISRNALVSGGPHFDKPDLCLCR